MHKIDNSFYSDLLNQLSKLLGLQHERSLDSIKPFYMMKEKQTVGVDVP